MENMKKATRRVLSNYATFSGRAPRAEFWWWWLAFLILMLCTGLLDRLLFGSGPDSGQPISALVSLGLFVPYLAVGARRLHDLGKSAWWLLLPLIPIIGALVLLYFYIQPGDDGENSFGAPNPL